LRAALDAEKKTGVSAAIVAYPAATDDSALPQRAPSPDIEKMVIPESVEHAEDTSNDVDSTGPQITG